MTIRILTSPGSVTITRLFISRFGEKSLYDVVPEFGNYFDRYSHVRRALKLFHDVRSRRIIIIVLCTRMP